MRDLRPEIDEAIAGVLDGGRFILGDVVAAFERRFADWCGAREAVGTASGTEAISVGLQALGVRPGDEVLTVANTCVPTITGIEQAGGVPVLVDADPAACTMDPGSLADAITERSRAVVPVHLYGQPADMPAILALARDHGLKVLEDAAH